VASAVAVDDEGQHIDLRPPEVADDIEEDVDSSADEDESSLDDSETQEN
jgi:hypothetical protein